MLKHARPPAPPAPPDRPDDHRYQNLPRRNLPLDVTESSKHSVASVSPGAARPPRPVSNNKIANGVANGATPVSPRVRAPKNVKNSRAATEEALTSLALLCLVSLLLALLSLLFLLKISPGGASGGGPMPAEELAVVYEVTLALCALTLSLNLCCLLVCAIQFLFAVKLVHQTTVGGRSNKYLQKSAVTRVCAVGGFFISIPVFLTGIILYTFIQFHSTPAIVTSVLIGLGIVFCGCAMVHNVFIWQKEKTNVVKSLRAEPTALNTTNPILNSTTNQFLNSSTNQILNATMNMNGGFINGHLPSANTTLGGNMSFHSVGTPFSHPITLMQQGPYIIRPPTSTPPGENTTGSPGVPAATLDLSHVDTHELSTLV